MKKINILLIAATLTFVSCKKDKKGCTDSTACNYDPDAKTDDGTCEACDTEQQVAFKFIHSYDASPVTVSDFNMLKYTNQVGNVHSITKLRYLISDVTLHKSNGDSVLINGYNLVDLTNGTGLSYTPSTKFPNGDYTGVSFTWGFDDQDNITGAYTDLNVVSWSWPMMLGGGYHFMQLEGKFISNVPDTLGFAYHNGIAREITAVPDTIFHPNHFRVKMTGSNFSINANSQVIINLNMDIAKWFKGPNSWDLNTYYMMLMPNYNAQIMMNQNGRDVFSYTVTQTQI